MRCVDPGGRPPWTPRSRGGCPPPRTPRTPRSQLPHPVLDAVLAGVQDLQRDVGAHPVQVQDALVLAAGIAVLVVAQGEGHGALAALLRGAAHRSEVACAARG